MEPISTKQSSMPEAIKRLRQALDILGFNSAVEMVLQDNPRDDEILLQIEAFSIRRAMSVLGGLCFASEEVIQGE